jgi:membrane-associated protein
MLDPVTIIKTAGLLGIFLIVFSESGLPFGFFLPGDTLLFASGIFALQGFFPITTVIILVAIAGILGGHVGYWSGKKMGRKLFEKDLSFFFNKKRIIDAENLYKKHGAITILISRFIPFVRTFSPIIAGVGDMNKKSFNFYNIIGGILWAIVVPLLGYFFGHLIPNPDKFLLPVAFLVLLVSFMPFILKIFHHLFFRLRK